MHKMQKPFGNLNAQSKIKSFLGHNFAMAEKKRIHTMLLLVNQGQTKSDVLLKIQNVKYRAQLERI
jgi:hypothetical protein